MFGAESTGKSTILERIAMLPIFPEGKDLCTRMAVDVRLRYANQSKRTAQLGVYLTEDGLASDGYNSQPLDIDSPDGKNKVREIMEMITKVDGKRTVDKEKTIRITVKGRDLPSELERKASDTFFLRAPQLTLSSRRLGPPRPPRARRYGECW